MISKGLLILLSLISLMKYDIKINNIPIPKKISNKWQDMMNLLAEYAKIPAALIMKVEPPKIEVFISSKTKNNPYNKGESEKLTGLYCETVIGKNKRLLIPNALKSKKWRNNPDIKSGMISYLGFPLRWPDGKPFGTICILDSKENKYNKKIERLIISFKELIEFNLDLIQMYHLQGRKVKELEKYRKHIISRELKMVELKNRIKELEKGLKN